jgi:PTS system galactitol-specific IIB component
MKKIRILVVCGTGIATSTVVARKLEEKLSEKGFNVETRQCKASEVESRLEGVDIIVTTTPVPKDLGVPVVHTLAFLTGIGEDEAVEEVIKKVGGDNK